jgi:hypothetical protein
MAVFKAVTGMDLSIKNGHPFYDGNLDLSHTKLKELPDGLEVNGFLSVIDSKVERLPENLVVKRYLDASFSKITELPRNFQVDGGVGLGNTHISKLPDNLTVNEWLDLEHTDVKDLPKGLTVNGGTYLEGSKIKELPRDLRTITLYMGGRTVEDPRDVMTPDGYIDLDKADLPVVQLPREQLSPLMRHYADSKKLFPNMVPIYHFNDRYETYHRDADRVGKAMRMPVQTSATHIAPDGSPARFVSVNQSDYWKLVSGLVANRIPYQIYEDMSRAKSHQDTPHVERSANERRELSQQQKEERSYSFHR